MADAKPTQPRFIFGTEPSEVIWPCRIPVPTDNGHQDQIITVRFKIIPREELSKLNAAKGDGGALDAVIMEFFDLRDVEGQSVPTARAKEILFKLPYCVTGFTDSYYEMISGRVAKN